MYSVLITKVWSQIESAFYHKHLIQHILSQKSLQYKHMLCGINTNVFHPKPVVLFKTNPDRQFFLILKTWTKAHFQTTLRDNLQLCAITNLG